MKLLIATRNAHKLEEIRALFDFPELEVTSALDDPELPDVEEDGDTLEANAIKKAATLAPLAGCWALADDTGLEVEALDGAPGVYSARYAGAEATYDDNNRKLLAALDGAANRRACFRCVIALADAEGHTRTVEGRVDGTIAPGKRGEHGFGYDPLFVPEGSHQSFAELGDEAKNAISHRGRALRAAREAWGAMLQAGKASWGA